MNKLECSLSSWFLPILLFRWSRILKYLPCGSTSLAIFKASELARSVLAGVTARIKQFGLVINCNSMSRICISISWGWSPTAIFVIPGRSIKVKFRTGKNKNKWSRLLTSCFELSELQDKPEINRNAVEHTYWSILLWKHSNSRFLRNKELRIDISNLSVCVSLRGNLILKCTI